MSDIRLSLIVPVYNVEKYLSKCLDSCLNQTGVMINYEIIIINDGSPDGSLKIAKEYADKHSNIRVISQENMGLSGARNNGINAANGDYVWFIDSDDWIERNSISIIQSFLNGADVVCQRSYYRNIGKEVVVLSSCCEGNKGKDIISSRFDAKAQLYIYKKRYLMDNDLVFKLGIYHEDLQFTPRALYSAKTVCCVDQPLYHYLLRGNSISTTINPKRVYDLMDTFADLEFFAESKVTSLDIDKWVKNVIVRVLIYILELEKNLLIIRSVVTILLSLIVY